MIHAPFNLGLENRSPSSLPVHLHLMARGQAIPRQTRHSNAADPALPCDPVLSMAAAGVPPHRRGGRPSYMASWRKLPKKGQVVMVTSTYSMLF